MRAKCVALFDLYINKFGHEMSYNDLMKTVPLAQTERSDVLAEKIMVAISVWFYIGNLFGLYSETYGNIRENSLEAVFACEVLYLVVIATITVLYAKAPKKQHIWHC